MELRIKDLQIFYGCAKGAAMERKRELIEFFEIKSGRVFIYHLSVYEGIPINEVKFILKCD